MKVFAVFVLICSGFRGVAQKIDSISFSDVVCIEKTLAENDMRGRKVFTPDIEKAASFIEGEFKEAGLQPLEGSKTFKQNFSMVRSELTDMSASFDGKDIDKKNIIVFSAEQTLRVNDQSGYQKFLVKNNDDFTKTIFKNLDGTQNAIILVDTSLAKKFFRLAAMHIPQMEGCGNRFFILSSVEPVHFNIECKQSVKSQTLSNVVGILPGKSKKEEYVIFSAHYDHLGVSSPDAKGDSIFNGANDDASGTTAVITLANYFGKRRNNERTLIFAAFTAEEIGEFGSAYFSKKIDPAKVVAMLNIEMIGTDSKWGNNSAYITGFDKSDMGSILQRNLGNTSFTFYPDPYPEQQLFLRSDNATLAKLGVPAHTISTSKMDNEPNYHKRSDEVETLDLKNMTEIIKAIGISATSIIAGTDTPSRVQSN